MLLCHFSGACILNLGLGPVLAPVAALVPVQVPLVAPAPLQALVALAHPAHHGHLALLAPQLHLARAGVGMTIADGRVQSRLVI